MQIEYVKGDLFSTKITTIVHGCNAQGVMGSGVAKIIREKYPKAYDRYRKQYEQYNNLALGHVIAVPCGNRQDDPDNFKIIVNAITQEFYGRDGIRYVSYDAVAESFEKINRFSEVYGITEIAMPQIGAGLGGGDWKVISAIIESELKSIKPYVYILE
jgi:O-acetyl-ADP-ribose deacetylase (regulator of RNase III)